MESNFQHFVGIRFVWTFMFITKLCAKNLKRKDRQTEKKQRKKETKRKKALWDFHTAASEPRGCILSHFWGTWEHHKVGSVLSDSWSWFLNASWGSEWGLTSERPEPSGEDGVAFRSHLYIRVLDVFWLLDVLSFEFWVWIGYPNLELLWGKNFVLDPWFRNSICKCAHYYRGNFKTITQTPVDHPTRERIETSPGLTVALWFHLNTYKKFSS